jgi:acid-sensing ion channel, other
MMSSLRTESRLKVFMERNKDFYFDDACTVPSFTVHSPFELPNSYNFNERINYYYGYDLEVLITPEIMRSDPDLKSFEPKKRGCYFEGEKKLKYFKVYSQRNCEFECYGDYMLKEIGCIPYFVVRNETTEVCDHRMEADVRHEHFWALRDTGDCECLEKCDFIKYKIEVIAHSNDDLTENDKNLSYARYLKDTFVSVDFKFKDVMIAPLRRHQPFTFAEFLAQSGGMMGLFAGISTLSIIEIFYFMTLRWMVNLWRWIVLRKLKH